MAKRKPRGQLGYICVGSDAAFHAVALPQSKEDIECWIVEHARDVAADSPPFHRGTDPIRNPEDHFDFTLRTASGDEFLDLMELVILPVGARGYEDGRASYDAEAMAEVLFSRIAAKSRRYGAQRVKVHLLLYATDWRFRLAKRVAELLTLMLWRRPHVFATICYFAPYDEADGEFVRLYPAERVQIEEYANRQYEARQRGSRTWIIMADLRRAQWRPGDGENSRRHEGPDSQA
jgi:hypothetical protein